jgi:hypothetical protein
MILTHNTTIHKIKQLNQIIRSTISKISMVMWVVTILKYVAFSKYQYQIYICMLFVILMTDKSNSVLVITRVFCQQFSGWTDVLDDRGIRCIIFHISHHTTSYIFSDDCFYCNVNKTCCSFHVHMVVIVCASSSDPGISCAARILFTLFKRISESLNVELLASLW